MKGIKTRFCKNYKGKTVEVWFYPSGSSIPCRKVIGKVTYIHTAQGIKDSNYITIVDRQGKEIPQYRMEYFTIRGEVV